MFANRNKRTYICAQDTHVACLYTSVRVRVRAPRTAEAAEAHDELDKLDGHENENDHNGCVYANDTQ